MNITATFEYDRDYYATYYSMWLKHRSRWRRFAIPLAALLLLTGVIATLFVREFRVLAVVWLLCAVCHAIDACSYRWRWIRKRVKKHTRKEKVELVFHDDEIATKTPHSDGTIRYTAFTSVTNTPGGIFLTLDTGMSIFVPRTAFDSDEDFQRVANTVSERHASLEALS